MPLKNCEQSSKEYLLHSQAYIWNQIFSFINPMSLKCAVQLEIPDIINRHGAPMTLTELVDALSIPTYKSQFVYRLMRVLVHSGFFFVTKIEVGEEDEGYTLAPICRLLLKEEPLSLRPLLLTILDPLLLDPWQNMSAWFHNTDVNVNPYEMTHGKTLWGDAAWKPELNSLLNGTMASDTELLMRVVDMEGWGVFEGLSSIVDVGGRTGTVAKGIAKAFPEMKCINFDLPNVIQGLEGSANLHHVGGDMFEAIPEADAVLLKWILHDWSDENCIKILKRCKEAIVRNKKGGKVIIIDMVVNNEENEYKAFETQLFLDMTMMVTYMGKERNEQEWAKLFFDVGFNNYKIIPIFGLRSLIEVYP